MGSLSSDGQPDSAVRSVPLQFAGHFRKIIVFLSLRQQPALHRGGRRDRGQRAQVRGLALVKAGSIARECPQHLVIHGSVLRI